MLSEHPSRVAHVSSVVAVVAKGADRVLHRKIEQRALLEGPRRLEGTLGTRKKGQVREPDPPLLESGDTRRKTLGLLAGGE